MVAVPGERVAPAQREPWVSVGSLPSFAERDSSRGGTTGSAPDNKLT